MRPILPAVVGFVVLTFVFMAIVRSESSDRAKAAGDSGVLEATPAVNYLVGWRPPQDHVRFGRVVQGSATVCTPKDFTNIGTKFFWMELAAGPDGGEPWFWVLPSDPDSWLEVAVESTRKPVVKEIGPGKWRVEFEPAHVVGVIGKAEDIVTKP